MLFVVIDGDLEKTGEVVRRGREGGHGRRGRYESFRDLGDLL
jgi:hypothetical protein